MDIPAERVKPFKPKNRKDIDECPANEMMQQQQNENNNHNYVAPPAPAPRNTSNINSNNSYDFNVIETKV